MDIVIDERNFEGGFCDMLGCLIELDVSVERQAYFSYDDFHKDLQCDYYQKIYKPGKLFVCFIGFILFVRA